jgi:DNA-binding transcriptional ArsR family regulator
MIKIVDNWDRYGKTKLSVRKHSQDYMKLEFLAWARETNHPEAWRGFMRSLSRLQQKIIFLIFQHGQHPVKSISKFGFEDERTVSSALFKLSKLGVVTSQKQGRESLYSIAEPGIEELIRSGSRESHS